VVVSGLLIIALVLDVIGRLRGILVEKNSPEILIECAGVGYEVTMPMTSIYALP